MIRNNNMSIASRMAGNHLKSSRRKSITMISAVLLSAFMLFCIFTVGITYFQMLRIQNLRLQGGEYDALMYGVTDKQLEICKNNPYIVKTGLLCISGYIAKTEYDKTPDIVLLYADQVYWDEMKSPVREWVKGTYPTEEDEVLVSEDALEKCGLAGLDVGDSFPAVYGEKDKEFEKVFRISGIWEGFGEKDAFFVSEKFYKQTELKPSDVSSGRLLIDLNKNIMTLEEQEALKEQMHLGKKQELIFTGDIGYSVQIFAGMIGFIFMICFSAYLLIYNIMYLSVAGNIRYYGLLQTIGMTQRQILWFIDAQILWIGGIGITGGLLLGCGISFGLVPAIIRSLGITTGQSESVMISFYPAVFLLTLVFTAFTIWMASRKPAKIAAKCSPMEALGYRPSARIKKGHRTAKGSLLWRMAKEQVTKDKRRSVIVMLSLAAGMTVLLSVTTLIRSQSPRNSVYNYRNFDLTLSNSTVRKEKKEERIQVFDQKLLKEIKAMEGIRNVEPVIYSEIMIPWEPDFIDEWMKKFYEVWMEVPYEDDIQKYKDHLEECISSIIGITDTDFQALNQYLEEPVDEKAFLEGKTCLLFQSRLTFENQDVVGKTITCVQSENQENIRTFEIAGMTDISLYTAYLGYMPTIIVSDRVVKEFSEIPMISKVNIWYDEAYDKNTEKALFEKLAEIPHAEDYSYDSKIEDMEEIQRAQGHMMEIGMGIVLILAFIGVMNYVNTSIGNIQNRQIEISVMESIGMTGKQVKKMLAMEGMIYAGGAWMMTWTAGAGAAYWIYRSMSYGGTDFEVPVLIVIAAMAITAAVCVGVPVFVYSRFEKRNAIVERVKGIE